MSAASPANGSPRVHVFSLRRLSANWLALGVWPLYCREVRTPLAAASCLALLLSKAALAQSPSESSASGAPPFSVALEKDELAVSCPELPWFRERIESHAGEAGYAGSFRLTLARRSGTWYAKIQRWEQDRSTPVAERVLQDRSSACEPLAEAAALTIAILADDYAQRAEPTPAPSVAPRPKPVALAVAPPAARDEKSKVWVGAGGGAAMSFISPLAPILGFSAVLDSGSFQHGLRVMLTTEQKFGLDPGHVVVQAWLATLLSCLRFSHGRFGMALCGALDGSMVRASAEGFEDGKPSTRKYGAAGLEAQPSWNLSRRYRISAALGALLPFTQESFSVTGKGVAYVPPSLNWRILVFSEIGAF